MNEQTIGVIEECAWGAHENTLAFPEIVQKLAAAGIERYHVDFLRSEITYYTRTDENHVIAVHRPEVGVGRVFQKDEVAAAVRSSQLEGQPYRRFVERVLRAGCTGYEVFITGERVIYSGRLGDEHVEYFPGSNGHCSS